MLFIQHLIAVNRVIMSATHRTIPPDPRQRGKPLWTPDDCRIHFCLVWRVRCGVYHLSPEALYMRIIDVTTQTYIDDSTAEATR